MSLLIKYWDKLFAIAGLIFFMGSWYERSGSAADVASAAMEIQQLQSMVHDMVENEKSHDRDITRLIDNQAQLQSQQAQMQNELNKLEKGHTK